MPSKDFPDKTVICELSQKSEFYKGVCDNFNKDPAEEQPESVYSDKNHGMQQQICH
jgi:hypothetical protein